MATQHPFLVQPTTSSFPGLSSGSAADRFVQLPCRHGKFVESSLHSSPLLFPPSLLTEKSKMTLMIWAMAEGHCGPQHLATDYPFPVEFRIQHADAKGFHLPPSKIYPWMNSLFWGYETIPGKAHGLLSYLWGFYAPLFQGCKTSHVFQSEPSHVTLFAH